MEDIPGYLRCASVVMKGKRKTVDTFVESVVETDERLIGKEGELTGFFGVYGGFAGSLGSSIMKETLRSRLVATEEYCSEHGKGMASGLRTALLGAQQDVYAGWRSHGVQHGVHSCVVLLRDGKVLASNAGGGSAVICRADGVVGLLTESGPRMDEAEDFKIMSYGLDWEDEFIILGCHSFWSKLDPTRAVQMARSTLRKYRDVKYVAQKLAVASQHAGAPGNIAVTIVLLNAGCAFGTEETGAMESPGLLEKQFTLQSWSRSDMSSELDSESSYPSSVMSNKSSLRLSRKRVTRVPKAPAAFSRDRVATPDVSLAKTSAKTSAKSSVRSSRNISVAL